MDEADRQQREAGRPGDERLLEALDELLGRMSREEAAALLGVSVRTVVRAASDERLTARMRDTLTLRLTRGGDGDTGALEGQVARLDARVQALEETVEAGRGGTPAPAGAPGTDGREARGDAPVRDAPASAAAMPAVTVPGVEQPVIGRRPAATPRRPYPELVTLEAEEGEELVYGRVAPLIAEWRRARAGHLDGRRSRAEQAADWVRMCELELVLISEHGLTLPPDSYPWDRFQRRDELRRRELWLGYARAERRRALCWRFLRRVLTLGIWRR